MNDTRPVRTLDDWAKALEPELVVFEDESGQLKIDFFENAVRNTLDEKNKLRNELDQTDEQEKL